MYNATRRHETELTNLMNGLAEATLTMTDDEVIAGIRAEGEEPAWAAASVRETLHDAARSFRQRHLRAASAEHQRRTAALKRGWLDLPATNDARRALLATVFARNPTMQSAFLTMQHREFKELSDADVESCLNQLRELGVLGDEPGE